ncbi:hypothetical protein F7U67_001628 [Vibrio metschnikovii]|uniref:hypothetical protein n=1 Tax=Vibrio cholerae TaxID=666 RepID=UPI0011F1BD44|nr:hypothetical protein [Vibrio cholerae]EKO3939107.1 hypothetical protein [Vibrio metschnikovii]QEO42693.1 hypothetical protein F0316_13945 [Vibrio cholerae]HAS4037868.1 hypothetical protein [Vibrio cholerae]HDP8606483.1 hypothetical protein [Vibrio cholerae]HDV5624500.1 hypothetical protein [Vibrio cholerae]
MFTPIPPSDESDYDFVSLLNKQTTKEHIQGLIDGAIARSRHLAKVKREHPELMKGSWVGENIEDKTMFLVSCKNHNRNCNKAFFYNYPSALFIVLHEFGESDDDFSKFTSGSLEEAVQRYNEIEV